MGSNRGFELSNVTMLQINMDDQAACDG